MTVSVNAHDVMRNKEVSKKLERDRIAFIAAGGEVDVLEPHQRRPTEKLNDKNRSMINSLKG